MSIAVFYSVAGPVLFVIGVSIVVFRERYAAWRNRAERITDPTKAWGPKLAAVIGGAFGLGGIYMTIFLGIRHLK